MSDGRYYDAAGFAISLGGDRYGPVSPLRDTLERSKRLIGRSFDYPVREMSDALLAEALKGIYEALASGMEARQGGNEVPSRSDESPTAESGDAHHD